MFVGDVFRGLAGFQFGRKRMDNLPYVEGVDQVEVSGSYKDTYVVRYIVSFDPESGKANYEDGPKYALDDASRVGAEYVVETSRLTGGSEREYIANEPHIVARRLHPDGSYNPKGELIAFVYVQEGGRSNFIGATTVNVHRTMKRVVNFV